MTDLSPRISVVVPTYDDLGRLRVTLDSILAQTVAPLELIVADDGSVGDVETVVASVIGSAAGAFPIRFVPGAVNTGSAMARRRGIEVATGDWIAVCDADDAWLPTKLEEQVAFIEGWEGERPLAVVGTWGTNVNDRLRPLSDAPMGPASETESEAIRAAGGLFFMLHSSAMFRKADHDAVGGYDNEYRYLEDLWLWARLAERGAVVCVAKPLVLFRKRPGSIQVSRFAEQNQDLELLALNQRRARQRLPGLDRDEFRAVRRASPVKDRALRWLRLRGVYCYRIGAMEVVNGRPVRGGTKLLLALILDPRRAVAGLTAVWHRRRGSPAA